jgi:hypothetical protein
MERKVSLLKTWLLEGPGPNASKEEWEEAIAYRALIEEIKSRAESTEETEDAVYIALELHRFPLTFNDIKELMPEKHKNPKKITNALKRLIRRKKAQLVIVIMPEGPVKAYATYTDTQILVGIPVWLFRELGFDLSIGFPPKEPKEPYDLYDIPGDWLMIHIDRIGGQSSERPSRKVAQEAKKRPLKRVSHAKPTGASVTGNRSEASSTC